MQMKNGTKRNKKAFTLAEILIAVALIGTLGAILVPAITQTVPDQNKLKLKSSHRKLETAVGSMINSQEAYPATDDTVVTVSAYPFQRGFNYTKATSNGTTNKFCYYLTNAIATVGTKYCPLASEPAKWGNFRTSDGAYWQVYNLLADTANDGIITSTPTPSADSVTYSFPVVDSNYYAKIVVDVDGASKGDNCSTDTAAGTDPYTSSVIPNGKCSTVYSDGVTCKKTPDIYIFGVRYDGKLQIGSADGSDICAQSILLDAANNMK